MNYEGGCFCGKVRYAFEAGDILCADCHCTMCRRTSGAPYVSWLVVPDNAFNYTSGAPKQLQSSDDGIRFFCGDCGTPVACTNKTHPEIVDVTLGSMDRPEAFTPTFTVFEDTKLPFVVTHALNKD